MSWPDIQQTEAVIMRAIAEAFVPRNGKKRRSGRK